MTDKNLSPSHFADEIEVQRSTISHILVGRNKPSLEIIQKIKRRFPDISYDWLIDEDDDIHNNIVHSTNRKSGEDKLSEGEEHLRTNVLQDKNKGSYKNVSNNNTYTSQSRTKEIENTNRFGIGNKPKNHTEQEATKVRTKVIEKVLIFYSDGTFSEFMNENS